MTDPTTSDMSGWVVHDRGRSSSRGARVDWRAPFSRLALCHLLSVSGETLVAVSLAGSLFFKVDPAEGREKVVLGLLFTMAPFALVGPFIGPFVDRIRGGSRMVIILTMVVRVLVAVGMTIALANDSIALFFAAFAMLVLAKTYQIAKAAVVPFTVADEEELVEANSKLQLLSGVAAIAAGGVGWVLLQIGPAWVSGATAVVFAAASVAAARVVADTGSSVDGAEDTRNGVANAGGGEIEGGQIEGGQIDGGGTTSSILVSGWVMALLRLIVGFSTFLLAFDLRGEAERLSPVDFAVEKTVEVVAQNPFTKVRSLIAGSPPSWYFGVVLVFSVIGGMAGAGLAPRLRRITDERRMLIIACVVAVVAGLVGVLASGIVVYATLAFGVAFGASLGKQSFDSVVQRDTAERSLGQVFSRYEAQFQMVWVVGALVPSLIRVPVPFGSAMVGLAAAAGAVVMGRGVHPRLIGLALDSGFGRAATSKLPPALQGRVERRRNSAAHAPSTQRSGKSGI